MKLGLGLGLMYPGSGAAFTGPVPTSKFIDTSGSVLVLTFTQAINTQAGGFTLHTAAGTPTLTYLAGLGTQTLYYGIGTTVQAGDTPTLDYSGTGLSPSPQGFTGAAVANHSGPLFRLPAANWTAATWTDASGLGNNATQGTAGNRFTNSGHTSPNGTAVPTAPDTNRSMPSAATIPLTGHWTKSIVCKPTKVDGTDANHMMSATTSGNGDILFTNGLTTARSSGGGFTQITGTVAITQSAWTWVVVITFYSFKTSPGSTWIRHLYINGQFAGTVQSFSPMEAVITSQAVTVGNISASTFGVVGDIAHAAMNAGTVPGVGDMNADTTHVNALYGTTFPTYTSAVFLVGDSITGNYRATTTASGGSWSFYSLAQVATAGVYALNLGRPGWLAADILTDAPTTLYPLFQVGVPTTCTLWCGTNDITAGVTASAAAASVAGLYAGLTTAGATPIYVLGMLPRAVAQESPRVAFNTILASTYGANYIDHSTLLMGQPGAAQSLVWYNADQTHPNDVGMAALYGLIIPYLKPGVPVASGSSTNLPQISGSTAHGNVLTATNGTFTNVSGATFKYQWAGNGVNISGATNSTYTTVVGDVGHQITCTVYCTNAVGMGCAVSAPTVAIT